MPGESGRSGVVATAARLAEGVWRMPLVFAAALFALSGPAHALGRISAVFYATLAAVTLGAVGVGLGLLACLPPRRRSVGHGPARRGWTRIGWARIGWTRIGWTRIGWLRIGRGRITAVGTVAGPQPAGKDLEGEDLA